MQHLVALGEATECKNGIYHLVFEGSDDVNLRADKNKPRSSGQGISSLARRFELKTLLTAAVVAVGAIGLAILAGSVIEGRTLAFDEWLLRWLREPGDTKNPIGPGWFEEMVRDVSALGSTFVLTFAVAVVAVYLWIVKAPQKAAFLVVAVSAGALLNRVLKLVFARPRPDIVGHETLVSGESFPSGHTTNSAIVYLMLGMMLARVEASFPAKLFMFLVCVVLTVMIGLSRVYLGVHWPTDVLAGWALGAIWVLLCWYALIRIQPSGTRQ
jgi:undecaprenyl-diphosphatase